jgi:hypothetical protein
MDNSWTKDIEQLLENIRVNAVILAREHKKNFFNLKSTLKYFKIPIIVLSACNSVLAVGLSAFISQDIVSVITCVVSLTCGLISSVELYLSIQKNMEDELLYSKEFYLLSVDIYKILNLATENRPTDAKLYLEDKYNEYTTLVERSHLLAKKVVDKLTPPQYDLINMKPLTNSQSDDSSSLTNNEDTSNIPQNIV